VLGKTSATTYDELVQRYAHIGGQPEGQISKVEDTLRQLALEAAAVGAVAGLVLPGGWMLLGPRRRRELVQSPRARVLVVAGGGAALGLLVVVAARPWAEDVDSVTPVSWQPVADALPDVRIPAEAELLQVDAGLLTQGTKRLVASAFDSYRTSSAFYSDAAEEAAALTDVRSAEEGETVAVLVSDRHDNIPMDPVARAIADVAGATVLLDAGDDTSTGSSWEAFSLESLDEAFEDFEHRIHVTGNHDNGDFVTEQAGELGFTRLDGEVVEGPDGLRLLGAGDPRSSGLGTWRDETGLSFDDVTDRLADVACQAEEDGERVSTLLVHDTDAGDAALERGCVDLVLGGHLHEVRGPDEVEAEDGGVGYTFTTGTTGGAAYAIAIGTKPRRDATVSLVTYREGRPAGIQWVSLSPLGDLDVSPWRSLTPETS
jgi:predicted phosphodiesterase